MDRNPAGAGAISSLGLCACALAALLLAAVAAAADVNPTDAQTRYQQDRSACNSGQSQQDRATCLREAGAALQESARGQSGGGQSSYEQNQLLRCDRLTAGDREDCLRRMHGEGTVSGSVEGGGIYRELRTTVPAQ
jgi:opacity protein-like surface antigen